MVFGKISSYGVTYNGKVILNVYDLSPANEILYPIGFGIHHSGVEINGTEYSFASGSGIFEMTPKEVPNAKLRESIELGTYKGLSSDIYSIISSLRSDFGPNDYHILFNNCNTFAQKFVWNLLGQQIPGYINRIADIGSYISCLIPSSLLESSKLGHIENSDINVKLETSSKFTGSGARLGSLQKKSGGNNERMSDDLIYRREKAKIAALGRMER